MPSFHYNSRMTTLIFREAIPYSRTFRICTYEWCSMKAQIFFRQILVFTTVTSNSPNFLPAKFSCYTVCFPVYNQPILWLVQQRILDSMSRLCCMSCDITSLYFCHTDINECSLGTHNCEQLCTNTPGSFTCSCRSGYTLNSDRRTCRASEFKPQIPTVYNLCML